MPAVCQVIHYNIAGNETKSFPARRLYSGEVDRQKQTGHNKFEEIKRSRVRGRRSSAFSVLGAGLSEGLTFEQRSKLSEKGAVQASGLRQFQPQVQGLWLCAPQTKNPQC